jgi:hypothetical protein
MISTLIRGTKKAAKTLLGKFLRCKLRAGTLRIPISYRLSIKQTGSSDII